MSLVGAEPSERSTQKVRVTGSWRSEKDIPTSTPPAPPKKRKLLLVQPPPPPKKKKLLLVQAAASGVGPPIALNMSQQVIDSSLVKVVLKHYFAPGTEGILVAKASGLSHLPSIRRGSKAWTASHGRLVCFCAGCDSVQGGQEAAAARQVE